MKEITPENNPVFFELFELKCVNKWRPEEKHLKDWGDYEIYATTTKDFTMSVWNGRHPVDENSTTYICPSGTRVRVWMVSRFGDAGITDNLVNPHGYNVRGVDADKDLINLEYKEIIRK
jgi:hypothetical protein